MPSGTGLDRSPRKNWVEEHGGLPPYIERIAKHLVEKGMPMSQAIATAINAAKKMAATGDVNFPGVQQVNAASRAEAIKAVAQWEALKARAGKSGRVKLTRIVRTAGGVKQYHKPIGSPIGGGGGQHKIPARGGSPAAASTGKRGSAPPIQIRRATPPKASTPPQLSLKKVLGDLNAEDDARAGRQADRFLQNPGLIPKASINALDNVDLELQRRATALGKPGQVSGTHKKVRDELAKRQAAPKVIKKVADPPLTTQNVNQVLAGAGLQKAGKSRNTANHRGQLVQSHGSSGFKVEKAVVGDNLNFQYNSSADYDAARREVAKAKAALESAGYEIQPGHLPTHFTIRRRKAAK